MAESPESQKNENPAPESAEPGILESYGSFPMWMLKIIQLVTPDFLISKTPPPKKKVRI